MANKKSEITSDDSISEELLVPNAKSFSRLIGNRSIEQNPGVKEFFSQFFLFCFQLILFQWIIIRLSFPKLLDVFLLVLKLLWTVFINLTKLLKGIISFLIFAYRALCASNTMNICSKGESSVKVKDCVEIGTQTETKLDSFEVSNQLHENETFTNCYSSANVDSYHHTQTRYRAENEEHTNVINVEDITSTNLDNHFTNISEGREHFETDLDHSFVFRNTQVNELPAFQENDQANNKQTNNDPALDSFSLLLKLSSLYFEKCNVKRLKNIFENLYSCHYCSSKQNIWLTYMVTESSGLGSDGNNPENLAEDSSSDSGQANNPENLAEDSSSDSGQANNPENLAEDSSSDSGQANNLENLAEDSSSDSGQANNLENLAEDLSSDSGTNLVGDEHFLLSEFGNPVCHPVDEEHVQQEPHLHNNVQSHESSENLNPMLVIQCTKTSEYHTHLTVQRTRSEPSEPDVSSAMCISDQPVGNQDFMSSCGEGYALAGQSVLPSPSAWHSDNFEGLPVLLENQGRYRETCPLDTGLMIILYQMLTNPTLMRVFAGSPHDVFNRMVGHHRKPTSGCVLALLPKNMPRRWFPTMMVFPDMMFHFLNKDYEEVKRIWAELIHWGSENFHSSDGQIMMPPLTECLEFSYLYSCTNCTCPCNGRTFCLCCLRLCSPEDRDRLFDVVRLQGLIDQFSEETTYPCGEHILHTRPDQIQIGTLNSMFYSESHCCGRRTTRRTAVTSPPVIVVNMSPSRLRRDQIGNMDGTVHIGQHSYYIGGLTFIANNHFTGRIILPHLGRELLYDNSRGVQVLDNVSYLEPIDCQLSLVFLFLE